MQKNEITHTTSFFMFLIPISIRLSIIFKTTSNDDTDVRIFSHQNLVTCEIPSILRAKSGEGQGIDEKNPSHSLSLFLSENQTKNGGNKVAYLHVCTIYQILTLLSKVQFQYGGVLL